MGRIVINPDYFLTTNEGRVWTPERSADAWARAYVAFEQAVIASDRPSSVTLVCGIQGAGKTSWISYQSDLQSRIYFDAALPRAKHRAVIIKIVKHLNVSIEAVWIKVPLYIALKRNATRPADEIVPETAIRSVAGQFEEPTAEEGFDRVLIVDNSP